MMTHHLETPACVRWRRLDVPGRETARFVRIPIGWRLEGEVEVEEAGVEARLRYAVLCDARWRTRLAMVEGEMAAHAVRIAVVRDGTGRWCLDGRPLPALAGAVDIDLGFTPATNTLPIRRLALGVGEAASVRSAWLRFPELRLEPLEQHYRREGECGYRYRALVDGAPFEARLETAGDGTIVRYEGLWEREAASR